MTMKRSSLLALLLAVGVPARAVIVDGIAAVVNDDIVTLSEVYEMGSAYIEQRCPAGKDECVSGAEKEVLDSLIDRALMRQELTRLELAVSAEDVDRAVDQIARDNNMEDRGVFRQAVEGQGVSWSDYREQLTDQLREMKFNESVLRPRVAITDDEIKDRYRRSVSDIGQPDQLELAAVGLKVPAEPEARDAALAEAEALVASLNAGEGDWDTLVAERDVLGRGGKMGRLTLAEMSPAIAEAVKDLPEHQVAAPVAFGDVLLLVRVDARVSASVLPLEQVEGRLREAIFQEKLQEERARWNEQARRRSAVRVLLD